jgi:hypothetical protein
VSTTDSQAAPQPVFVVGVPRSGTTWVQRMLAMHPEAWGLLETYMFSRRIGLGALLRPVPPTLGQTQQPLDLPPPGLGRVFTREELIGELRAIAERWLRLGSDSDCRFAIEKSPWHLSEIDLIAEVLPEARFVHVVRDGRDVATSLVAARRSWSGFGDPGRRATVREAARLWSEAIEQGAYAQAVVGDRVLEVRYEALRSDPVGGCARMFAHCRMPFDQALAERVAAATDIERDGTPRGEDRAVRAGRVGDWRERFGLLDALAFERLAGASLRSTGYEPDPRWWLKRRPRSRL